MKTFFRALSALLFLTAAAYFSLPVPMEEGRTYYYAGRSSSSEMIEREDLVERYPGLLLGFMVKAASVYVPGNCDADEILKRYSAWVLFTRESEGLSEYYCFSPKMRAGITLKGREVNFHLAVGKSGYSIGTPMIFGGY